VLTLPTAGLLTNPAVLEGNSMIAKTFHTPGSKPFTITKTEGLRHAKPGRSDRAQCVKADPARRLRFEVTRGV